MFTNNSHLDIPVAPGSYIDLLTGQYVAEVGYVIYCKRILDTDWRRRS